jgi:hypothetical protein
LYKVTVGDGMRTPISVMVANELNTLLYGILLGGGWDPREAADVVEGAVDRLMTMGAPDGLTMTLLDSRQVRVWTEGAGT